MCLREAPGHGQLVSADDVDEEGVFLLEGEVVDVDEALGEVLGTHGEEAQVGHHGPQHLAQLERPHLLPLPTRLLFRPPEGGGDQVRLAVQVEALLAADGRHRRELDLLERRVAQNCFAAVANHL